MNKAAGHDEKTRLQNHYDSSARQPQPGSGPGPSALANSHSGSGSNTVPTAEEVDEQDIVNTSQEQPPRGPTPPPYSGPSTSAQQTPATPQPAGPQFYPGLPRLDYRHYSPPLFQLSVDCTTLKSSAEYLSTNPSALASLIRDLASVPPKPQVHITGSRGGSKPDFAVKLNLLPLLIPDVQQQQRLDYIRCPSHGEIVLRGGTKPSAVPDVGDGGLDEWTRRFVDDPASVKSFTLVREMVNFDAEWVEGQVRKLVAETGYKGVVSVGFPVTHAKVVVQNPDRVNKFFTSVATLFAGKRKYEVVKAVWPFATARNGEAGRRCAVVSEETWWRQWKDSVRFAIITGRQGWVTNEDRLEAIMEGVGKNMPTVDWGPVY
ncbi:hypothetical protein B0T19DRAFT_402440 [Cercophora scortea]|uniref:Uncharacterized protein n=1 Tax=Cercophora scortea TaxID=314031 RepID=A0AAE0IFJ1_9PEZI|nr:hypothetical protein B0T19DRAFT_402440 [Cercophora scortea]